MTTATLTETKVTFDAEENLYLVYDRDGDVQDGYETEEEANQAASELEEQYAEEKHASEVNSIQGDIQSLVDSCDNLDLLKTIKAMLEGA
jgi:hypothetical protein